MSLFLSGKIQTLLDRVTQTLVDNLDTRIDAAISSRLASNDSRLDFLDTNISSARGQITLVELDTAQSTTINAPAAATWARVILVGAGASGERDGVSSAGDRGGGGGEIREFTVAITGGAGYPVTVGAGGAGGATGDNPGGNTEGFGETAQGGDSPGEIATFGKPLGEDSNPFKGRWSQTSGGEGDRLGTASKGGDSRGFGGFTVNGAGGGGGSWGKGGQYGGDTPEKGGGGAGGKGGFNNAQSGADGYIKVEFVE